MARLKDIEKLTLREMMYNFELYSGISDGLILLPVPEYFKLRSQRLPVPLTLNDYTENICYGQRMFLSQNEENDFGVIFRVIDGYYYPLSTNKKWDADKALLFGKKVLPCTVKEIYPIAMHLIKLVSEMADREQLLLHREPSKIELAAGIEKLNIFSELSSLDFLRDAMKITVEEVLLTPYKECLVRFMMAKETDDYRECYFELIQEEAKSNLKHK